MSVTCDSATAPNTIGSQGGAGAWNFNAAYTVTGWLKCTDPSIRRGVIQIDNYATGAPNMDAFQTHYSNANTLYIVNSIADAYYRQPPVGSPGATISAGTWYFWVIRRTAANSLELRLGTSTYATETTDMTGRAASDEFTIGLGEGSAGTWYGSLAQIRIWSTNLTDEELTTEKNSPTAVKTANLWAEYRMTDLASIRTDSSVNGRTLNAAVGTWTTGADDPPNGAAGGLMWL